jgi:nitrogen fixation protein NifU and related proteins
MSLEELYKEVILDHYKAPRNKRGLDTPSCAAKGNNPLCGDEVTVALRLEDGVVAEAAFEGQGCSISQASASMMTEAVVGKTADEAQALAKEFRAMMAGEADPDEDRVGDLVALKGVVKYPVRVKCAVLAWDTLQEALDSPGGEAAGEAPH